MAKRADLYTDIADARQNLLKWRQDGNADQIEFWRSRLDELIDQLPRKAST